MDDLTSLPLSDLALAIRARKVSSVEATGAFLDRIARLGPTPHASLTVDRDGAPAAGAPRPRPRPARRPPPPRPRHRRGGARGRPRGPRRARSRGRGGDVARAAAR